jgi:hypothetical protein
MDNKEKSEPGLSNEHFTLLPNPLLNDLKDGKLEPLDIAVYAVYSNRVGAKGNCWVGNKSVAASLGISARTVQRCTRRLEKAGHIRRKGNSQWGTRYTFLGTRVKKGSVVVANEEVTPNGGDMKPFECETGKTDRWSGLFREEIQPPAAEQERKQKVQTERVFEKYENPFTGEEESVVVERDVPF